MPIFKISKTEIVKKKNPYLSGKSLIFTSHLDNYYRIIIVSRYYSFNKKLEFFFFFFLSFNFCCVIVIFVVYVYIIYSFYFNFILLF